MGVPHSFRQNELRQKQQKFAKKIAKNYKIRKIGKKKPRKLQTQLAKPK